MKSFEQFLNESTKSHKSTRRLHEATEPFEITDTKDMSVKDATAIIDKNYPKNLTYKGMNFLYDIYYKKINGVTGPKFKGGDDGGDDVYLGYLPKEDLSVSVWDFDVTAPASSTNRNPERKYNALVAYIQVDDTGKAKIVNDSSYHNGSMFGGDEPAYDLLKAKHKNLVDIDLGD